MLELKWKFKHIIGVLSCTHGGSKYAILPPDFKTEREGNLIGQNRAQEKLWAFWKRLGQKFDEFGVQEVWHLGDLIDGKNPKAGANSLLLPEIRDQRKAAKEAMEVLVKDRFYRQLLGSAYHLGEEKTDDPEAKVAQDLGGVFHGPMVKVDFEDSRHIIKATHGTTAALIYPETIAARHIRMVKEAEAIEVYEDKRPITVFVEGHLHYAPHHIHRYGCHFIRCGTWKIWDGSYPARREYGNYPKINAGIMMIDHKDRFHYLMFDFKPTPALIDTVVTVKASED